MGIRPAYYNENDAFAAQWLRNLIAAGHIAPGDVDERSIVDVRPDDLRPYRQCHFFAGIGGWSLALRLAGWDDDRECWTGSCPCQPFSAVGKGGGGKDERHLWPHWFALIRECKPAILFGEQVEAAIGWGWLDAVCADLEAEGYATGAAVLGAHSVGAPHIRQRLWFVANRDGAGCGEQRGGGLFDRERAAQRDDTDGRGEVGLLADTGHDERTTWPQGSEFKPEPSIGQGLRGDSTDSGVADANGGDASAERLQRGGQQRQLTQDGRAVQLANAMPAGRAEGRAIAGDRQATGGGGAGLMGHAGRPRWSAQRGQSQISECPGASPWSDCVWLPCTDGGARPTQPGIFPLASRVPNRVGQLRAYGNAIVPQVAAEFIGAACAEPGAT